MRGLFFLPLFFILSIHCAEEVLFATKNRDQTDFQTIKSELEKKIKAELSNENTEIKKAVDDLKKIVKELMTKIHEYDENAYCAQTFCEKIDGRISEEQTLRKNNEKDIKEWMHGNDTALEGLISQETLDRKEVEARVDCSILPDSVNHGFEPGCPGAVFSNGNPSEDYCRNIGKANDRYKWHQNCCKWEKQQCVPINEGKLERFHWNDGYDCYPECGSKQGPCAWCGSKGMCCKIGWIGNGCNGNIGGLSHHECSMYDDNQSIYKIDAQVDWAKDAECDCDLTIHIHDNEGRYCSTNDLDWYEEDFEHGRLSSWAGNRLGSCDNWVAKGGISYLWISHGTSDGLTVDDWYITGSTKTYHCPDGHFLDNNDVQTIKCY